MIDASRWAPRVSSLHMSGTRYWCSHSLYGAFLGIFFSDAAALAASEAFDLRVELETLTEREEALQLIAAKIWMPGLNEPIERYIAYEATTERHPGRSADSRESAEIDLAEELGQSLDMP